MLWRSWRSREDDAPSTTSQQHDTATTDDVSVADRKGRAVTDSSSPSSSSSSLPPTTEVIKRPPFLGIGATLFFVAFTGAALYGFRAAKKADLREAQEAAASAARVGTHAAAPARAQQAPSALSGSTKAKAKAPAPPPSAARGLDWGSAGKSAPSVLSKSGGGGASSSSSSRYAVPLPKMSPDGKPIFDEPPALTAIKAFGAATALVAVTSVAIVEVGRRVLGIQDVYDLTDRLHAFIPKTFALPEAVGNYLRPRLAGLFPQSDEDRRDPLAPDSVDGSSARHASASSSSSSSSWLANLFSQQHQAPPTAPAARDVEDVFTEIEHAPTMKQKLELLDAQLRGEKALEDAQRVELRLQREMGKGA